jgi:hypothetical protein
MAFFHAHLRKVRVMLLVDLKTGLGKTPCQNSCFWGECLYVVCAQNDQELKICTESVEKGAGAEVFFTQVFTLDFVSVPKDWPIPFLFLHNILI